MLLGDKEHVEIRPEGAADIGEQKVDSVEGERAETPAFPRCHRLSHSVPIARVIRVNGAPILK